MECSSVYTPLSPVYPETSTVLSNSVLLLNACTEWKKLNQTVEGFHNMALLYLFNHILLFWLNLLFLVEVAGSLSDCESYLSFKVQLKTQPPFYFKQITQYLLTLLLSSLYHKPLCRVNLLFLQVGLRFPPRPALCNSVVTIHMWPLYIHQLRLNKI